jgi:hypothetical protein
VAGDPAVTHRTLEAIADTLARLTRNLAGFEGEVRDVLRQWDSEK